MGYDGRYILQASEVSSSGGQTENQILRSGKGLDPDSVDATIT